MGRRNTYLGASALGALPAVLAYPSARLHPDKFREGLRGMAAHSGLDFLLTESALAGLVEPLVSAAGSSVRQVLFPFGDTKTSEIDGEPDDAGSWAESPPEAPCLLQHSSGTTGLQKPVILSNRAVLTHLERYGRSIGLSADDKVVSWLPLYHDMGLIAAFYVPLTCGVPLVQLSPVEWVAVPAMLTDAITREKPTLCWLPNFAYNFMADRIRPDDLRTADLSSIRLLVNCSEQVRPQSHDRLSSKLSPRGLRREVLSACYAMAETTFAVTQSRPGEEARRLVVDRAALARGEVVLLREPSDPAARVCVSSGPPIEGCALRVVDDARNDLGPGRVGELAARSVSLFDGYRNYPEKTKEVLVDGWYFTGDLGFVHEGDWYVIGRKKDVVIVAGNNIFPEDIEDAVGSVAGVIAGRVVAFGTDDEHRGTEILCVVAETDVSSDTERRSLRAAILAAGMAVDATISRVYLVPARWLIKSSSGKPARAANRERVLAEFSPS